MNTIAKKTFLPRGLVYRMLSKESEYASRWEKDKESQNPIFPDNCVARSTGQPFTLMEWKAFAQKYLNEAETAYAEFCPDLGAIRIRLLKAASLLVTALQVHGEEEDLDRLAGVSSADFPILHGGLKTFTKMKEDRVYVTEDGVEYMLAPGNKLRKVDEQ